MFIKRNLKEVVGNYEKVKQGRGHTVMRAVKGVAGVPSKAFEGVLRGRFPEQ